MPAKTLEKKQQVMICLSIRFLQAPALAALLLLAPAVSAKTFTYRVRHLHTVGSCQGRLIVGENDVRYETDFRKDARIWTYIQLKNVKRPKRRRLSLSTYEDQRLQLGRDRPFDFVLLDGDVSDEVFNFMVTRVGRQSPPDPLAVPPGGRYELLVKHVHTFGGCEGTLKITLDFIEYVSPHTKDARLWKYLDIKRIRQKGAYQLSLHTYEDQLLLFGRDKVFHFDLKEPMGPAIFEFMQARLRP